MNSSQPKPKKEGFEVTPKLLEWLNDHDVSPELKELINQRYQFGLKKYGQALMTDDGRDTMIDAREEAGDLLQYLYKAYLTGISADPVLKETLEISLKLIEKMNN